jgi:hypothetical protein
MDDHFQNPRRDESRNQNSVAPRNSPRPSFDQSKQQPADGHRMPRVDSPVQTEADDMTVLKNQMAAMQAELGELHRDKANNVRTIAIMQKELTEVKDALGILQHEHTELKAEMATAQSRVARRASVTFQRNDRSSLGLLAFLSKEGKLRPTWPHIMNVPNPRTVFVDHSSLSLTLSSRSSLYGDSLCTSIVLAFDDWTMYPTEYYVEVEGSSRIVPKWQLFHGTNDKTMGTFPTGDPKHLPGKSVSRDGTRALPFIPRHGISCIRLDLWAESKTSVSEKLNRFEVFGTLLPSETSSHDTL